MQFEDLVPAEIKLRIVPHKHEQVKDKYGHNLFVVEVYDQLEQQWRYFSTIDREQALYILPSGMYKTLKDGLAIFVLTATPALTAEHIDK
jgi:hypothetical protein